MGHSASSYLDSPPKGAEEGCEEGCAHPKAQSVKGHPSGGKGVPGTEVLRENVSSIVFFAMRHTQRCEVSTFFRNQKF